MNIEAILHYWFGADADDTMVAKQKSALWWSKNPATDEDIRQHFASWVTKASTGELADWQSTPSGLLALILLTDQFPRNIYRDSPRAFAQDTQALAWCLERYQARLRSQAPTDRKSLFLSAAGTRRSARLPRTFGEACSRISGNCRRQAKASFRRISRHCRPPPRYHRALRALSAPQQNSWTGIHSGRNRISRRARIVVLNRRRGAIHRALKAAAESSARPAAPRG